MFNTPGSRRKGSVVTYILLCLCITFAGSLIVPVLSFYMTVQLHYSAFEISSIFVILPIISIFVVQGAARLSDGIIARPLIISIACLFGIASPLFLSSQPEFILFCTLGFVLLSIYPVAYPQIFASAREYALKYMTTSVMYTTFLRSLASLSWSVGPPIAYFIATDFSFNALFYTCSAMYLIAMLSAFFFLPHITFDGPVIEHHKSSGSFYKNRQVILLFIAIALLFTAFSSYIVTMPLYLTQELKTDEHLPGMILGLAAFIEIPLMFLAARMVRRLGLKFLVIAGSYCLVIFLGAMCLCSSLTQLLLIQIFSATFIALVSNLGMIFFQELLVKIPGQATSVYINACTTGQIIGGALISLSSLYSYKSIYLIGALISLAACVLLHFVKKQEHIH